MPPKKKPTILFIPGAWHHASCWDSVRSILHEKGFETAAIDLPLNNPKELSDDAFARDVEAIRAEHRRLIDDEGREVVQVMHSYGGCPGSEALKGRKKGGEGGVVGLVYCAAFMLPANMAGLEYVFQINAGGSTTVDMKPNGLSEITNPMESMYFDLPPSIAAKAMKDLVPCDTNAFGTNFVTYAAYLDYPTTYVICEDDVSLLPMTQGWSISRAKEDGAKINVMKMKSAHMPMLKDPKGLAECIEKTVEGL